MRYYIDCNCRFGRTIQRDPLTAYEPQEMFREMERCGIHAAVAENDYSVNYAYRQGNKELFALSAENPRLYPLAMCPSTYKWEQREGEKYLHEICRQAKGIIIRPKTFSLSIDPRTMEQFVDVLIQENKPLVIPATELQFIDAGTSPLVTFLDAFPDLQVLLTDTNWGVQRMLFSVLERCNNLYFELSDNQTNGILDIVKKYFGVDRVLFGSGYPKRSMGVIKSLIEYSGLSESDKDQVAHGNACRLFGIVADKLEPYFGSKLDEIAATVDKGLPLDKWFVFDSHAHIADVDDDNITQLIMPLADMHSISSSMDKLGVDKIIFSAWEGIKIGGCRPNDTVYKAMTAYPEKMYGYVTANPNYDGDIDKAINDLETRGFVGLKPYAVLHGKLTDPGYIPWFEYGNRRKLFMLAHTGTQELAEQVKQIAPLYPDMIFIMAHSGVSMEIARINVAVAKEFENIVLEITFTSATRGSIEYMVSEIGSERVLFGTDLPMRDSAPQLVWVAYAEIPVSDKINILGENMRKILDRILPPENTNS